MEPSCCSLQPACEQRQGLAKLVFSSPPYLLCSPAPTREALPTHSAPPQGLILRYPGSGFYSAPGTGALHLSPLVSRHQTRKHGPDWTPPCNSGRGDISPPPAHIPHLAYLTLVLPCSPQTWSPRMPGQPQPRVPVLCASVSPRAVSSYLRVPQSCDLAVTAACLTHRRGKATTG